MYVFGYCAIAATCVFHSRKSALVDIDSCERRRFGLQRWSGQTWSVLFRKANVGIRTDHNGYLISLFNTRIDPPHHLNSLL